MTGTFSYIIPLRNSKNTISKTLDSALRQGSVLEIILVDDHSEDNLKDVIGPYLEKHDKIKYIRNEMRLGAGLSRNAGARIAKGDILVFLDADIIIPPDTGKKITECFFEDKIQPQPDATVAHRAKEGLRKEFVSEYKNYWTSYNFSKLKGWTSFLSSAFVAIKKDVFWAVNGFRGIPCAEDNDLGYRLAMNHYKIYFLNELAVSHNKKFSVFSLLKREFGAGREGIKVLIANGALSELVREKKFFAVNENFIYSFPAASAFSLCAVLSLMFLNPLWLLVSMVSALAMIFLNREFLAYARCGKDYLKGAAYIFLMILQMNVIGLGLLSGLLELCVEKAASACSFIAAHAQSFFKLFIKRTLVPEQVTFFVTQRCNLSCSHCFVAKDKITEDKELSTGEIDRITRRMPRIKYVTITGGEPFLRGDIVDVVRILNKNLKPMMMTVLTNGDMTDVVIHKAREILESCPKTNIVFKMSMDGPSEIHDKMRRKAGAFDNSHATFVKLKKMKQEYRNLTVGLITTYTERNKDHIKNFVNTVITELRPDQYGLTLERPKKASELNNTIDADDYLKLLKEVNRKLFSSTKGLPGKFRLAYKIRMADKLKEIYGTKRYPMQCFAGVLNATLSADGDVFACEQIDEKFGNLREEDCQWNKVWRSSKAQSVREAIKQKKCFCTNECLMPFNIVYDFKELWGVLRILMRMSVNARRKTVD
ncbi:MAG: glycosyltransferase [Candidatus Omnitrophota bacterium]